MVLTLARTVLGIVGVGWALGLAVVVVGTFLSRIPVIGFFGSFVSGQYPLHAGIAAVVGVGLGLALLGVGAGRTGAGVTAVAVVAVVGTLAVLGAQRAAAGREGTAIDWGLALTAVNQSGAAPDRTVRYSDDPPLDLDLFLPPGPGPHPVMVWAHGGSWVRGERTDRERANRWYADHGLAVVAVSYRLPGDVAGAPVGEGQRGDLARAMAWARGPGAALGLDPARVVLGGQSAGATLALSTTAALVGVPGSSLPPGVTTAPPVATVAFYPVVDLRRVAPNLQDAVLGGPAASFPAATRAGSPADLVAPGLPPTLLVLGRADNFILADLVRSYDAALRRVGTPGRLVQVPYADHVFDFPYGSPGAQLARPVVLGFAM